MSDDAGVPAGRDETRPGPPDDGEEEDPAGPSLDADLGAPGVEEELRRPLPDPVRQRVVALASETLGTLDTPGTPAPLRPFARFAPGRRARLAATPIGTTLETDVVFRQRVSEHLARGLPELVAAVREGHAPPAADPLDLAAAAYLVRPTGWTKLVEEVAADLERNAVAATTTREAEQAERLRDQLGSTRHAAREERERLRSEIATLKQENAVLRQKLRQARDRIRAAESEAEREGTRAESAQVEIDAARSRADAELRRLRSRLASAESAAEGVRRTARESRDLAGARLRLLLETVVDAAQGLRRELGLPPAPASDVRPADTVQAAEPGGALHLGGPDAAVSLDDLLALPQVHLIVDGYNVTKTAWPASPLEIQRTRLVAALGALAARTGAEITVVFDGARLDVPPPVPAPRGVRVRFSPHDVIADDVIRALAAAEPPGRPVVVVSTDREIADDVRRSGARPVPSATLVRALT